VLIAIKVVNNAIKGIVILIIVMVDKAFCDVLKDLFKQTSIDQK